MIKIKFKRKLNQLGDTIPEVLICLAILGLTIVSAYTLTNRSQTVNRSAQERTEALKLADGQLELLKAYTDTHSELPKNDYFCLEPEAGEIKVVDISSDLLGNPDATYPSNCLSGDESRFSYAIWSPDKASDTEIGGNGSSFAIIVRWEGFFSAEPEEVKTFYAIYEGSNVAFQSPASELTPLPECNNTYDDDEDDLIDEEDPACHRLGADPAVPGPYDPNLNSEVNPECFDGIDNDGDDLIDYGVDTYGCTNWIDDQEQDAICYNGIDDDSDGRGEWPNDPGCDSRDDEDECNAEQLTVSTASLGFESWHLQNTGGSKPSHSITITNPSSCWTADVGTTPISGSTNSFSITSNGCASNSLSPGETCNITVRFFPPSGGDNNRLSNTGNKTATLTINNNTGLPSTPTVSLAGKAFSNQMGPNDGLSDSTTGWLVPYNSSCYKNVEACASPFNGIYLNGNLGLGGTYCSWGGWGAGGYGAYTGGNVFYMQGDGNAVFYDAFGGVRYASWTNGNTNYWLRVQNSQNGVYISNGSDGPVVKWLHADGVCFAW